MQLIIARQWQLHSATYMRSATQCATNCQILKRPINQYQADIQLISSNATII